MTPMKVSDRQMRLASAAATAELDATPGSRELAMTLINETINTPAYRAASEWIFTRSLKPVKAWATCTVAHVCKVAAVDGGFRVDETTMAVALAHAGFTAREINGQLITNISTRTLKCPDKRRVPAAWHFMARAEAIQNQMQK